MVTSGIVRRISNLTLHWRSIWIELTAGDIMSNTSTAVRIPQSGPVGRTPFVGSYPLLIALLAVALGVSGAPAPLYGIYQREWHLAPLTTTLVFAVYAFAALGSVLVAGKLSDRFGRKPILLVAVAAMVVGLVIFMTAQGVAALFVARVL